MFKCKKLYIWEEKSKNKLVEISFEIKDSLALIGESGSGKSISLKAILGLLPKNLKNIFEYEASFSLERGKSVSFVPQNPFTALSPLTKIKHQFFSSMADVEKMLEMVNLEKEVLEKYPSELSGGQLQRIIIAMALIQKPKLLLLDEPTTALDFKTKLTIVSLLKKLQEKIGFLTLFVSHDIEIAKEICENIAIIKEGKIVEKGKAKEVLLFPKTEYTKKLIEANFAIREFRK